MFVFLFLSLSLALCQSEPLGKLVVDPPSEDQVEKVDQGKVDDSLWWSKKEERQLPLVKPCKTFGTKCQDLGGVCYPSSQLQRCDYTQTGDNLCNSDTCRCCINCKTACHESQCLETGGTCRKACECKPNEYTDVFNPCPASGCSRCRECESSKNCFPGICATDTEYYLNQNTGYFVDESKRCTRPECSCIQKCKGLPCASVKGTCIRNDGKCPDGHKLLQSCGCDNKSCGCCVPMGNQKAAAETLSCKA